jgi:LCP family protein required for cell wall assembly
MVWVLMVGALGAYGWTRIDTVPAAPTSRPADAPGATYLMVGSDSRAGLSAAEQAQLHTGTTGGQRTDTILLLHVPASGGPAVLVSLPRDSWVPIPGHGRDKLNAAYSLGGPQLLVETVESVTGLHVDHYFEIGFGGFVGIVDAVGGVDVCVPSPIDDEKAGLHVTGGCQVLDGPTALAYVRARYFDPRGDLGRVERQQQVLAALADRLADPATLANPLRLARLAHFGGAALTRGEDTGPVDAARFALGLRAASGADGIRLTVPIADPDYRTSVGSTVRWDRPRALALFTALAADQVPPGAGQGTG